MSDQDKIVSAEEVTEVIDTDVFLKSQFEENI